MPTEVQAQRISDQELKAAIEQTETALRLLRGLEGAASGTPEVEGHAMRISDERLKTAIEQTEAALKVLRELEADAEVEAHAYRISDARLKRGITSSGGLSELRRVG